MTKQHFVALADMIRECKPVSAQINGQSDFGSGIDAGAMRQWQYMTDKLADLCEYQSPRFNRQRWLDYIAGTVGPNGGKR